MTQDATCQPPGGQVQVCPAGSASTTCDRLHAPACYSATAQLFLKEGINRHQPAACKMQEQHSSGCGRDALLDETCWPPEHLQLLLPASPGGGGGGGWVSLQVAVDVFGGGPDLPAIQAEAARRGLPLSFLGHADHCSPVIWQYKVRTAASGGRSVQPTSAPEQWLMSTVNSHSWAVSVCV